MRSALVFLGGLSVYLLGAAQGRGRSGWDRRKQRSDRVSCGWGMGADRVVQVQNLCALAGAEAEVQLVTPCLSGGMGAEFVGRSGKGRMFETGKKVQEEGHGSEGVWAVAVLGTETLMDKEAG